MKLAFESYPGPDASPVLLLLHGFLSSRAQWIPNIESLCEFCRPVTAELWGHGSSPVPGEAKYYKAAGYSEAFETLRKKIGVGSWFVCGQSFRAGLIANYSLRHPEVVRGQILTNSLSAFSRVQQCQRWILLIPVVCLEARDDLVRLLRGIKHEQFIGKGGAVVFVDQIAEAEVEIELTRKGRMFPTCLLAFAFGGNRIPYPRLYSV
jgi:pimeloyl-ACP methyl ester carboxylesterase